jgi:hypothetical protein
MADAEALAAVFERFAAFECAGHSRLYERLARGVAAEPELLALAALARPGQPVPNLLLAAVHHLLLGGAPGNLAGYYPSVGGDAEGDPVPAFRAFCRAHRPAIAHLLATRRVQTNEVRRSACLLPGFARAAELAGGRPLAVVEVGAAAGLNLRWDRYRYDYGSAGTWGDLDAPLLITCDARGTRPLLPASTPAVDWRVGIDLDPIDVRDPDAAGWLRALLWPDQPDRAALLERAIAAARADPPRLLGGDALDLLPGVLAEAPPGAALCVVHTFVLNQLTLEGRQRFAELTAAVPFVLAMQRSPVEPHAELRLDDEVLARCDPHGGWLEWLA